MSFQVGKLQICLAIVLLAAASMPIELIADNGYFAQTAHGNPTTGVQRDPAQPRGNCVQCHTGHGQDPQDFGLWTADDNNLCFTCHPNALRTYTGQTLYSACGHAVSTSTLNNQPVGRCVQCHNPHGAGDSRGVFPHSTARLEEQTCYACHGAGFRPTNALDIQTQTIKPYAHRVGNFERLHDDNAEFSSVAVNPNPLLSGANRHVECMDCHNTHFARGTARPAQSSNISEMQLGSWGVRPTYSGTPWTSPTSYVPLSFQDTATNYEYYLCLKCHSNWSWGTSAPYTTDGTQETNVAMEISPANPAYHNVTGQASLSVPAETGGTYLSPWTRGSAMACSDCHASDQAPSIRGPHGSTYNFMLKKPFQAKQGLSGNTGTTGTQSHLCFSCHDWNTYGSGNGNATNYTSNRRNLHLFVNHQTANGCFQCHSVVPHGFKRKHMIVYVSDGPPYFIGGTNGIMSYTHAIPGQYSRQNCSTTSGCH